MAKRPGAGGIILVAVVLGLITAYVVFNYIREIKKKAEENWQPVVVAKVEIGPRTKITREMITELRIPQDHMASDAITRVEDAEGKVALDRIRPKDQLRAAGLAREGQGLGLTYDIPPGKRAIAIKVDEVSGVGATVQPGDRVDILATYTDPVARQETTQMILQNVLILAVDRGRTQASQEAGGASSSITMAVSPEDTELIAAADRAGVLRVSLRPAEEHTIVASPGTRVTEILRGRFEVAQNSEEPNRTPIVIQSAPSRAQAPLTIYRGTAKSEETRQE